MGDAGALTGVLAVVGAVVALLALALWQVAMAARRSAARGVAAAATMERRVAAVLAAGRDGIIVHSTAGEVLEVNEAAALVLDVPVASIVGQSVQQLPVRWVTEKGQDASPGAVFARSPSVLPDAAPFVVGAMPHTGAPVRFEIGRAHV